MAGALGANLETVESRGVTQAEIDSFKANIDKAISDNNNQEKLKADLKKSTADLEASVGVISKSTSEFAKLVKMLIPQERWKEFGIVATR